MLPDDKGLNGPAGVCCQRACRSPLLSVLLMRLLARACRLLTRAATSRAPLRPPGAQNHPHLFLSSLQCWDNIIGQNMQWVAKTGWGALGGASLLAVLAMATEFDSKKAAKKADA